MATATKAKKDSHLRHAEYYDLTEVFDDLYAKSKAQAVFTDLMPLILSEENIRLAYRNIKRNTGSRTAGVDHLTMKHIEKLSSEEVVSKVRHKLAWYKPKPVRRVEIPKSNGKTRPLGIPAIWDRLVQQCILQVLEPICEAKFHDRSNGFRPNRSTEHAIAQSMRMVQIQHLHFVVDVDIKGFFDNVNHTKLMRQMWTLGIQDKRLLCIIKEMLKAPVVLPNGEKTYPDKGTPQGGILSPLLSNIVLNELDWWVSSQWEDIPTHTVIKEGTAKNGTPNRSNKCRTLRRSNLKEMYIVRYADDFRIFCRKRSDAVKTYHAVKQWLEERLKLQISEEKSKVVNLKKNYSEFLGFKLKAVPRGDKYIVRSHMCDKAIQNTTKKLKAQIDYIQHPVNRKEEYKAILLYNSMVIGIHQYFAIATIVSDDCYQIGRSIRLVLRNRMRGRLSKHPKGQIINVHGELWVHYSQSKQMRYMGTSAILPIGYCQTRNAQNKRKTVNKYTTEGRKEIHRNLRINTEILHRLMRNPVLDRSIEYADNRISLYAAQYGKCAVTGWELEFDEIHCHHKLPVEQGGTDAYANLVIVRKDVHRLIHAKQQDTIDWYLRRLNLDSTMRKKLNRFRQMVGNAAI